VDTFQTVDNSMVLVQNNTDPTQNGVYDAHAAAWTRNVSYDTGAEMVYPITVSVKYGSTNNARSEWYFYNLTAPTLGTDAITIRRRAWPEPIEANAGLTRSGRQLSLSTTGISAGTYNAPKTTINSFGQISSATATDLASTYIEGLIPTWLNTTQISISYGSAAMPDGSIVTLPSAVQKTLTLTANSWYYIYLYDNGGVGDWEYLKQKPSVYRFPGQAKGGPDNATPDASPNYTRRLIYIFRTYPATANVMWFDYRGSWTRYINDPTVGGGLGLKVVTAMTNTTFAAQDASAFVPPASVAWARAHFLTNNTSGVEINLDSSNSNAYPLQTGRATSAGIAEIPLNSSQNFYARNTVAGGSTDVAILGYLFER
jgi:hypothetical protein